MKVVINVRANDADKVLVEVIRLARRYGFDFCIKPDGAPSDTQTLEVKGAVK